MTKYPCGNDIEVNWTLDLGGMSVDLAECSLLFEYYTGLGSKIIPGSEYSIDGNVLSWTFKGEDQVVYGVYGLRLVASSGGEDIVFKKPDAFEIVHGIAADEEQTLPLASSVETEQEPAADPEPEQSDTPVYVSSSPIHVEKVPLGSNITVRWRLLTTEEFDFRLEDCTLNLYYAAAGSGFKMATGYTLDTTDGYVLVWNFAAGEQVRYGLYSLLLDVRQGGTKVATLVKDDAFALVHRRGSVFPDRVIDFESVVTTMGGGALYTLLDVINDGYSTVYRSDGVTPAQRDDLLVYNGAKWYAIDAGSLSAIRGLRNDFASLELTTDGIFARVTDLEGDIGELWLTAREFGVRMSDAEGYIGQLTLTAREFEVRMSDAEGNIGQLSLTAQQFAVRMSDAEGNIGQLALTAQQFGVRMSDIEGNVGELALTAQEFGVRMTNAEGSIGQLSLTAEEFAVRMSDTEGNVSLLQQTATSLTSQIQDAQGNISTLQQTATSLTSRIQNAEGSISTIAQTAESIQLQVDNQQGDIATLEVSARAITSRVSDAEGNISILEQTATSLTSQIEDAEGNISTLQQTAASLTSQIEDAEGNISTLQQTATQISSRVTSIEGEFGEGGRVTVAESEIIQQAGLIATKVSQTEYDANNQAISTHFSTIEQTASQISTRVAAVESEFGEGGRVTVAESTIVQQAGLIATKVSQTEYDANNQAISTHFSTIEQTASQISTRVAAVESEFGEGGRVTVAESTIVQQAGLIATKVSQTDYDANNQAISTRFSSIEQTAGEISASVTNVSNNLSNYEALTDAVLTNLQDQIDGVVETWYAEGAPTLSNYPVNTWAQADYPNHIGDLYYDKATGKAYRFMLDDEQDPAVYVWVELADEDIAKALALAGEKRRVFVSTPYAPYDAGDLWVKERTVNGETTREIYRCKRSRAAGETIDLANDWVPADDYAVTVNKANLKILADAIVGEVAAFTYDSEGKISSSSKSNITQTADAIRLSVSNQAIGTALGEGGSINDALLDTGIDITNGDITLTANHIKLQNQSAVSGLELVTIGTGANQRVVINTSSLNVAGIFTTSEWTGQNGIRAGILSDAETAAETYANSSAYLTNYVLPVVQQETSGLAVDAEYNYLKTALENRTTALGGLLLTSLIQLGATQSGSSWEVHSGISGEYVATSDTSDPDFVAGHGIAAWYGGAMVDREDLTHYWTAEQIAAWNAMTEEQREVSNLAAKTLFRMDGSGYLANGAISWGAAGDLHLLDNVYIGPQMNQTLASISTFVTLLSTWFKDDTITINGTDYRVLRVNMASDPASTTGFQGVVWNGFFISGGDQIVISGTPGGGGGGGGATTLAGLDDTSISNPQAGQMLSWNGTKWVNTNAPTGSITSVSLAAGATNGTLHLVVNGTAQSDVAVTGLGSMAYASTGDYVPIATAKTITATHTFSNGLKLTTAENWSNIDRALYFGYPEDDSRLSYYNVNSSTGLTYNPATGALKAGSFVKRGGTSSQFLKADGSVDSNTYLTGIDSTMVTNALGYIPADRTHLLYNPSNSGVLVKTNLAATSSTMLEFVIEGNGYYSSTVVFSRVQAYNYPPNDVISSGKAINYGTAFSSFSVFNYNGYIYLWFPRLGEYQTFRVSCFTQLDRYDHVDEITSAGIPSGATRRLDITPDNAYTTANLTKSVLTTLLESDSGYYVKKSGDTMTGILTLNHTYANPSRMKFVDARVTGTTGGWADSIISIHSADESMKASIGWYGNGATPEFVYFGFADYYGKNIRIYPDGTLALGNGTNGSTFSQKYDIYHQGNLTLATLAGNTAKGSTSLPIYYTGSALAPITDLDLLSQPTGYVKANKVYLTSSVYFEYDSDHGYVTLNAPFVTSGDQIVISGTPGGGGGGGATSLWGLDDVNIPHDSSYPGNGDLLSYDLSTHKWVNVAASSVGGVTSVAGRTGAITLTTSDITNIETWISGKGYITSYTDTKNTTGADNTTSKIFLVGPTAQTTSNGSARTYSNSNCYASGGYLYSGGLQVLTSHQTLYNLVINNSAGTAQITYKPGTSGTYSLTLTNAMVGLSNVENTALSTWAGTTNITTLGTITSGTWSATTIAVNKGGTGLTTWTGAYRLVYSTAATTLTTLAPNSTTTRKFLRQVGANNAATAPAWDTVTKTDVGLSNVENTALSTWTGTNKITTLGTITTGVWNGSAIGNSYLANSSITINGSSTSLGGSFSTASITAGTAGQSTASSGVSFSIPYVTMNAYGIVTGYGTHTHTISAQNLYDTIGSTKYAPYNSAGYLPLTGGKISGSIVFEETAYNSVVPFVRNMVDYSGGWERRLAAMQINGTDIIKIGATGNGTSVTYSYIGVNGYTGENLRFYPDSTLKFGDNTVWHAGNSNKSDVTWACSTLTASGDIAANAGITLANNNALGGLDTGGTRRTLLSLDGSNGVYLAWGAAAAGYNSYISGNNISFLYGTGHSNGMCLNSSGNVGIGTTSPSQKLHVSGNILTTGYVAVGTGGTNSYLGSDAANNIFLHTSAGYPLVCDGLVVRRGSSYATATLGSSTYPWANISSAAADFRIANYNDFKILRTNASGSAGITYYAGNQTTNYWTAGSDPSTYSDTTLNYRFFWYYTGSYVAYITRTGTFTTTGDQVVSSDLTLKTNLKDVTYSVSDIAKARAVEFDWRDGRGHSMGSIAQDWLSIAPALVHGKEGNMSLAYGQLALVNTILLARQSESHEERIKELEARVAELEMENERLRMN